MIRWLTNFSGLTIALFLAWKVALLVLTQQPVPANDSFFYDGPVVNYLLHGKYYNPSLANVLPISGNEVFCAYPPLYQAVLLGWMKCFGTGVITTMWFHLCLLTIFSLTVWRIFRELNLPPIATNIAGLFLFGITFHDRPDTLAHVLGALAVLAWVRKMEWPVAVFLVLTFCTSLQIGGLYALWVTLLTFGSVWLKQIKFPLLPVLAFVGALGGLVALVKFGNPHLWEGFREHVKITPSVTGWRIPLIGEVLKSLRAAPGILLTLGAIILFVSREKLRERLAHSPQLFIALCGALASLTLIAGSLFVLSPNTVHSTSYLQPVIVGCFLAVLAGGIGEWKFGKVSQAIFVAAAMLVSIRAIGMTTWGVLCARDVNYASAIATVNRELDSVPLSGTAFISSAYLYETATRTNITWLHSDWPVPAERYNHGLGPLTDLKPAKIILTQFDYYRRYEGPIAQFRRTRGDVDVEITNLARVQSPDAIPVTRQIVQHISWAPVVVTFTWPKTHE